MDLSPVQTYDDGRKKSRYCPKSGSVVRGHIMPPRRVFYDALHPGAKLSRARGGRDFPWTAPIAKLRRREKQSSELQSGLT